MITFEPDIIFLDIKMPGKDGFAFIHDLPQKKRKPGIVFVTAYEQYAIKAIKNQAFDYLLKPVNRKELKQCILKFIERMKDSDITDKQEKSTEPPEKFTRIQINTRTGTVFINPAIILYCKADGNYTTICTGEKQHLCSINLGKVKELLPGNGFIRVGRSYIINYEYITMLDRKENSVTLARDGESVTIKISQAASERSRYNLNNERHSILKNIIYSSWFLAGIPAILIIVFLPPLGLKYKLSIESGGKLPLQLAYSDMNSDGISEMIYSGKGLPYFFISVKDYDQHIYDQWNLTDSLDPNTL